MDANPLAAPAVPRFGTRSTTGCTAIAWGTGYGWVPRRGSWTGAWLHV
jgi:uncharacterized membrane protein